ncbi:MAG: alpha-L-fucosidase [Bacteroidetes bacterium]|nr:alpha-L-fucosidase [Bacteroidota bacterium]
MKWIFRVLIPLVFFLMLNACTRKPVTAPLPVQPVPTLPQLEWHSMEMNAFVHFSINTFTNKEWGYGDESPDVFNPSALNTDQWANVLQKTGFKTLILTCKHHDGFCLWPSEHTNYSVKFSKWKNGTGDVVGDVSASCRKFGLRFGIYVSPWDRHHSEYATPIYIIYYRNQLKELDAFYGPFFEMWFDGANGGDGYYGGKRETRTIDGSTYYDWPGTIRQMRIVEPNLLFFSDAGPGLRWTGNEKGMAGETNWNMITPDTLYAGKAGITDLLNTGSENGSQWIPAEVDVSIRPGWFYHPEEDDKVKSPEELFNLYLTSVGRGSTLLLNVPPDRRGLLHEKDVASLEGFRKLLDERLTKNKARKARVKTSESRDDHQFAASNLVDGDRFTYWATSDDVKAASAELEFDDEIEARYILLQEYIELGQRIKSFSIEARVNDEWKKVAEGTTIGFKRIIPLTNVRTNALRINILDSRACLTLSSIEVY